MTSAAFRCAATRSPCSAVAWDRSVQAARLALLVTGAAALLLLAVIPVDDAGAALAAAIAGTVVPVLAALVVAYAVRGRLPKPVLHVLPLLPLAALPAVLSDAGARLHRGRGGRRGARVAADRTAGRQRAQRGALPGPDAAAWLALAGALVERWLADTLVAVLALLALVGLAVPRLGPGRRRAQPRHDTLGPVTGAAVAVAVAGLGLAGSAARRP